jgi:hypothetical protein
MTNELTMLVYAAIGVLLAIFAAAIILGAVG